jgi:hypothetical protein
MALGIATGCGGGGDGTQDLRAAGETPTPTPRFDEPDPALPTPLASPSPDPGPATPTADVDGVTPSPTPPLPPGADGVCFLAFPRQAECSGSFFPASLAECCEASQTIFGLRAVSGWCSNQQLDAATGRCGLCRQPCEGLPTPTPPAPGDAGTCFIGSTTCTGTFVPASREECCNRFQPDAAAVPVSWCPQDQFDPATRQCEACSDPCTGLPSPTPTAPGGATPTPTPTADTSPTPHACDVTNPCPPGQLCELPAGVCASGLDRGMCTPVPDFCFDTEPVCGCDGLTYGSDCLRRAARVQKAADGPCPVQECGGDCDCYATRTFAASCPLLCPSCGSYWSCEDGHCIEHCGMIPLDGCDALCAQNEVCPAQAYCAKPVGGCDGPGACRPRPAGCPDVFDPVCGCDGQTYGNACEAASAGVAVATRGECRAICGTLAGIACPDDQFCEFPPGTCEIVDQGGVCVEVGGACPLVIDPVCGCDGVTYGNDCMRLASRVNLRHRGACAPDCGTLLGIPCPDGQFCDLPPGTCNVADLGGVCVEVGEVCLGVIDPVCGCDGVTYDNDCLRLQARVALAQVGPCQPRGH